MRRVYSINIAQLASPINVDINIMAGCAFTRCGIRKQPLAIRMLYASVISSKRIYQSTRTTHIRRDDAYKRIYAFGNMYCDIQNARMNPQNLVCVSIREHSNILLHDIRRCIWPRYLVFAYRENIFPGTILNIYHYTRESPVREFCCLS